MKTESCMRLASLKALGYKEGWTWELSLRFNLGWLDRFRDDVRELTVKKNTPAWCEEDAKYLKLCRDAIREFAGRIGVLVAKELQKGNDEVLLCVADGWKNMRKGKPWDPSKHRSDKVLRVWDGVRDFEPKYGRKPTRKELAEFVGQSRADTSYAIRLMGIEDRLLDGRQERHKKARRKS